MLMCVYIYIYIYIYREREGERERYHCQALMAEAAEKNLPVIFLGNVPHNEPTPPRLQCVLCP